MLFRLLEILRVLRVIVRHLVAGVLVVAGADGVVGPEGRLGVLEDTLRRSTDAQVIGITRCVRNRLVLRSFQKWRYQRDFRAVFSGLVTDLRVEQRLLAVQVFHIDLGRVLKTGEIDFLI